jgi:hypothetical protein
MISPARFDRIHAKGAFARLCSMLADPAFAYERIGGKFGLTRQRIAHIATTTKRKTNAMTYSRYSLMWSIHHDRDLYARRDPEGKDGAREHASAGVTAGSSGKPAEPNDTAECIQPVTPGQLNRPQLPLL